MHSTDERVTQILRELSQLLTKHNHPWQASVVSHLADLWHNRNEQAFLERYRTVDMWGGSGAVWDVILVGEDGRQFQRLMVELVNLLDSRGHTFPRATDIATTFSNWLGSWEICKASPRVIQALKPLLESKGFLLDDMVFYKDISLISQVITFLPWKDDQGTCTFTINVRVMLFPKGDLPIAWNKRGSGTDLVWLNLKYLMPEEDRIHLTIPPSGQIDILVDRLSEVLSNRGIPFLEFHTHMQNFIEHGLPFFPDMMLPLWVYETIQLTLDSHHDEAQHLLTSSLKDRPVDLTTRKVVNIGRILGLNVPEYDERTFWGY